MNNLHLIAIYRLEQRPPGFLFDHGHTALTIHHRVVLGE